MNKLDLCVFMCVCIDIYSDRYTYDAYLGHLRWSLALCLPVPCTRLTFLLRAPAPAGDCFLSKGQ